MAHSSGRDWQRHPGSWDTLHMLEQFPSSNNWGIPDLLPDSFALPAQCSLNPYTLRDDSGKVHRRSVAHFFLDDYRFESVWLRPLSGLGRVARFRAALTPDFSLYRDWPLSAQLWNIYRSRWVGRFWQSHGIHVIATVSWSIPASFDFCFHGITTGSVVAISVPDKRDKLALSLFTEGFYAMLKAVSPRQVIVYGKLPFHCDIAINHPQDWIRLRK